MPAPVVPLGDGADVILNYRDQTDVSRRALADLEITEPTLLATSENDKPDGDVTYPPSFQN